MLGDRGCAHPVGGHAPVPAKEIIFAVLSKGYRISSVMHMRHERLLCLARVASRPVVTHIFTEVIWESGGACLGRASGERASHGDHPGGKPAQGLVVLGRPGTRSPAAVRAGAPLPHPAPDAGEACLPGFAPA